MGGGLALLSVCLENISGHWKGRTWRLSCAPVLDCRSLATNTLKPGSKQVLHCVVLPGARPPIRSPVPVDHLSCFRAK